MAKIEVFTAGTYLCEAAVNQVKALACDKCEIVVHDLNQGSAGAESAAIARSYGVTHIPAIAINGKVVDAEKAKRSVLHRFIR